MKKYTRPCVENLEAYRVETPHYDIILNANENPWDFPEHLKKELCDKIMTLDLNRYPEACFPELLSELSDYTGLPGDQIICGCGSDELIAMINQSFVNPGDVVVTHLPSFAMYQIWTDIADGRFIGVPDLEGHIPDLDKLIAVAQAEGAKLIYLCNPNNPTGYLFSEAQIRQVLDQTEALVILDEAYMEFDGHSYARLIAEYPNLLVLRTLSKAFGLAGIRCGYCLGSKALIDVMYKVKSPYNLNSLTQAAAVIALRHRDELLERLAVLNAERAKMIEALKALPIDRLYPTASNFIYFESGKSAAIYEAMKAADILIKLMSGKGQAPDCIRLSVGTPEENAKVLEVLREVL
ncbi:MAG: histidinol-phosphate transaminase [Eubacterium sp.]|nr:histidinol-phosphate transaminase [Eubacterium sp.]